MSAARDPFAERLAWHATLRHKRERRESTAIAQARLRDATNAQLRAEVRARKRKPKA